MKLSGTIVFFVDWRGTEKKILNAHTNISREWTNEDKSKTRINRSIDIVFGATNFKPEQLAKLKENVSYTMEVEDGWLSLDRYKDRTGELQYKIVLHIAKAKITKAVPIDPEKRKKALEEARARKGATAVAETSPLEVVNETGEELPF